MSVPQAFPAIAAKPVIDVQITVAVLEPLREWQGRLARLGYGHHASPDDDRLSFLSPPLGLGRTLTTCTCADLDSVIAAPPLPFASTRADNPTLMEVVRA